MTNLENIKASASRVGGPEWEVLAEAINDSGFQRILTNTQRQLLSQLSSDPNRVSHFEDQYSEIVSKYITWSIYKKSGLATLKREVTKLSSQVEASKDDFQTIADSVKFIGGAAILVEYSHAFDQAANDHGSFANQQMRYYLLSIALFITLAMVVFFVSVADFSFLEGLIADDLKQGLPFGTAILTLKALILIFVYQITLFFKRNYFAEKHLQEIYRHRRDVLQSLHAVHNALSDSSERDKILSAGALFAYDRGETGYITTKEGAGTGAEASLIESVLSRPLR